MNEGAQAPAEISQPDRTALVCFFRGLKWYALPRMAYCGLVAFTVALYLIPRALHTVLPFYPGSSVVRCFWTAGNYVGLAAAISAAVECFSLKGYRGEFRDDEWSRLALSAWFWLGCTLVIAGALTVFLIAFFTGVLGPNSTSLIAIHIAVGTALAAVFALWQRPLAQLCGSAARTLGGASLASSAAWVAGAWWVAAASSVTLGVITLLAIGSRSMVLATLIEAFFLFLLAFFAYGLFLLRGIIQMTADLLAHSECE